MSPANGGSLRRQELPPSIGKYRILEQLHEGTIEVIYKSFEPVAHQPVALKTIRKELLSDKDEAAALGERFRNEAQAAGRLLHPGIVAVYEYGEDAQFAFIAMEYVEGGSLRQYFERKVRFEERDLVSIMAQLLEVLQYAHDQGVWHRDIKPANIIILNNGRIKVADFGNARVEGSTLTQVTAEMGTPGFIAPEQYLGEEVDHRVDIFAAGVVFYELLAGKPPFSGSKEDLTYKVCHEAAVPPSVVSNRPSLARFDAIVLRALAKRPQDRYPSADKFRADLLAIYNEIFSPHQLIRRAGVFGKYQIIDEIGHGGSARVYRARNESDSIVALKIFDLGKSEASADAVKRFFETELAIVRSLNHPNIVKYLDAGMVDEIPYIAMELFDAGSLEQRLLGTKFLSVEDVLSVVEPIADAVDYAHGRRLLHRDIKPSNILFANDGRPVLSDFGIAHVLRPREEAPGTTTIASRAAMPLGTAEFMAPEVLEEAPASPASDIYSLGMTVYLALSGGFPTDGRTSFTRARDRVEGRLISLNRRNPAIRFEVSVVVMTAIATEPKNRYRSARAFVAELRANVSSAATREGWQLGKRARQQIASKSEKAKRADQSTSELRVGLTPTQMARMSALLDEALDLDLEGRRRWLQALSPEYEELKPALQRALLRGSVDAEPENLATLPKVGAAGPTEPGSGLQARELIGPYRLLRPLGAGGMAEVWLAQRADGALKREVALKLPMLSRLRKDLASRFARERDILAGLEHPNIARLYDAGVSSEGLPYLAMEYVHGQPLTAWCDLHRLGIRERLKLFLQVLDAVQYAHGHQVIHRDIKPSNILVTDSGQVRLLDFGVAKLLAEEDEHTQLTQIYGRALTPDYASPELVRGEAIGAAVDVYSLGVVLYELLAGGRPYRVKAGASVAQLEQAIATAQVQRPSTQLGVDAGAARATSQQKLARRLRGDLDAIVLKALAKAPEDRYRSAEALADDLQRFLDGEPVEARPDRLTYRFTKFVLRHPAGVSAAVGGLLLFAAMGYELIRR